MAASELTLTVVVSPTATAELADIWRWNAERYNEAHADEYIDFVKNKLRQLPVLYKLGRPVPDRPGFHYLLLRRRAKGHAHIAVYRFDDNVIDVLHIFHSAQDWQTKLAAENQ
jgi:plasmid stabilization system protein ParE